MRKYHESGLYVTYFRTEQKSEQWSTDRQSLEMVVHDLRAMKKKNTHSNLCSIHLFSSSYEDTAGVLSVQLSLPTLTGDNICGRCAAHTSGAIV